MPRLTGRRASDVWVYATWASEGGAEDTGGSDAGADVAGVSGLLWLSEVGWGWSRIPSFENEEML